MQLLRKIILTTFSIFLAGIAMADTIKVVDADDQTPLEGCTVYSSTGVVLGYTDSKGVLNDISKSSFPLTVSCTGYSPAEVRGVPAVPMKHITYTLPEVNVSADERPVRRTICYVRQYASVVYGPDTVLWFNEMMMEFFNAPKKTKGFSSPRKPRILSSEFLVREIDETTDTVYKSAEREIWLNWEELLSIPTNVPAKKGDAIEVEKGKYGIKKLTRRTPETIRTRIDYLSDNKGHIISPALLKVLGLTIDITKMEETYVFECGSTDEVTEDNFAGATLSIKLTEKGKFFKKLSGEDYPADVHVEYEIFPVETQYLSVAEAKSLMKDKNAREPMRQSKYTPALPAFAGDMLKKLQ